MLKQCFLAVYCNNMDIVPSGARPAPLLTSGNSSKVFRKHGATVDAYR